MFQGNYGYYPAFGFFFFYYRTLWSAAFKNAIVGLNKYVTHQLLTIFLINVLSAQLLFDPVSYVRMT